ncbi:MAG TPA: hypothetical protein VGK02_09640 [Candidatus Aquicultor sp.]|jgi:hypothetical protein
MNMPGGALPQEPHLINIKRGKPHGLYIPITLSTVRGDIECRYYNAAEVRAGAIWVGGVGGDWDSPARGLYPNLCEAFLQGNISSLRVRYRYAHILDEATFDVLAGISFMIKEGRSKLSLTGHSFGGAVVIQAAVRTPETKAVVTLATQCHGADVVDELPPNCALLLIHGTEDTVLPDNCSRETYELAHEPKKLVVLEGNGHILDESAQEAEHLVREWITEHLV